MSWICRCTMDGERVVSYNVYLDGIRWKENLINELNVKIATISTKISTKKKEIADAIQYKDVYCPQAQNSLNSANQENARYKTEIIAANSNISQKNNEVLLLTSKLQNLHTKAEMLSKEIEDAKKENELFIRTYQQLDAENEKCEVELVTARETHASTISKVNSQAEKLKKLREDFQRLVSENSEMREKASRELNDIKAKNYAEILKEQQYVDEIFSDLKINEDYSQSTISQSSMSSAFEEISDCEDLQ